MSYNPRVPVQIRFFRGPQTSTPKFERDAEIDTLILCLTEDGQSIEDLYVGADLVGYTTDIFDIDDLVELVAERTKGCVIDDNVEGKDEFPEETRRLMESCKGLAKEHASFCITYTFMKHKGSKTHHRFHGPHKDLLRAELVAEKVQEAIDLLAGEAKFQPQETALRMIHRGLI